VAELSPSTCYPTPVQRAWWIPSAFGATLAIIALSTTFVIHIKADDIWWHLRTGEFIASTWTLPDLNWFSFTAPHHPWLPHEWLSEVVFYLIYAGLGFKGLIGFGILLNVTACGLVYRLTQRYSQSPFLASVVTLLAALMMLGNFSLRPYLFGNLFFIGALHTMEEPTAGGRFRPVILFLLFSSWANFHGSFIIGLALILLYMAASMASHLRGPKRSWASTHALMRDFAVALAACIFTPHHVYGLIFPFQYLENALSGKVSYLTNISEWQSAGFTSPLGRMITFYVMFCLFAVLGSAVSPTPVHLGLLVAFSFFSYTTIRNIPLLGIAATPVLARHLPKAVSRITRIFPSRSALGQAFARFHAQSVELDRRSRKVLLPGLVGLFLLVVFLAPADSRLSYDSRTGVRELADLSPDFYPRGLIAELKRRGTEQRVFNYFNWGGAFQWGLYPAIPVFIDQRNDCYPIEVFLDYFAVHEMKLDWRFVLDRWEIDAIAYPPREKLTQALRQDIDWIVAWEDSQAVLFVRLATTPWSPPTPTPDDETDAATGRAASGDAVNPATRTPGPSGSGSP
jgi:hypothetical protein